MAKKSRRVRKKGREIRLSEAQRVRPEMGEVSIATPVAAKARPAVQASDLREEYRYVITDLKRIGVIAAAMLVVLVALAFLMA